MNETLSYATPTGKRLSKLAIAACIAGLSGFPIFLVVGLPLDDWDERITPYLLAFLALSGIGLGIGSLVRISRSKGALRGVGFGIVGLAAAIVWPLVLAMLVAWVLSTAR